MNHKQILKIKKGDELFIGGKRYYVYADPLNDLQFEELSTGSVMDKHTVIHIATEGTGAQALIAPPDLFVLMFFHADPSKLYLTKVNYGNSESKQINAEEIKTTK